MRSLILSERLVNHSISTFRRWLELLWSRRGFFSSLVELTTWPKARFRFRLCCAYFPCSNTSPTRMSRRHYDFLLESSATEFSFWRRLFGVCVGGKALRLYELSFSLFIAFIILFIAQTEKIFCFHLIAGEIESFATLILRQARGGCVRWLHHLRRQPTCYQTVD